MQDDTILRFNKVAAGVGSMKILQDLQWEIRKGEHWVLKGASSSGKTQLMQSILGKSRIFEGHIHYDFLDDPDSHQERRARIELVSFTDQGKLFHSVNADHYYQQRYNAFDADGHLTVRAYLQSAGFSDSDPFHTKVLAWFGLTPLLDLDRIKLSSGQTRKMILARALLRKPSLLLLDNPHIGLDDQSRVDFNDHIDELVSINGQTVILAGQFRSLPTCITHELRLDKGKIIYAGPLTNPKPENDEDRPTLPMLREEIAMIKDQFNQHSSTPEYQQVLRFDNVSISYHNKRVLENFSWTVQTGEKWALMGGNGSGKSTLLSLLYGDHPQAYANDIQLFGHQRGRGESIWDIKKRIGYSSPELHAYFRYDFKAIDVVLSGLNDSFFVGRVQAKDEKLARGLFLYFQIEELLGTPFHALSTGVQRLLFFMRALIKCPMVLVLDEPFQGLDPNQKAKCLKLLEAVLTDQHTLIFVSHFPDEVPALVKNYKYLSTDLRC